MNVLTANINSREIIDKANTAKISPRDMSEKLKR